MWLVLRCGSIVLAVGHPRVGIGYLSVFLAFGLTVPTMAFVIGHISGCHLNPVISIGRVVGGRFPSKERGPSIIAQVLSGIAGTGILYRLNDSAHNEHSLARDKSISIPVAALPIVYENTKGAGFSPHAKKRVLSPSAHRSL